MVSYQHFGLGEAQDILSSTNGSSETVGGGNGSAQHAGYRRHEEDWREVSDYGIDQDICSGDDQIFSRYQQQQELPQPCFDQGFSSVPRYDMLTPPLQMCLAEIARLGEIQSCFQDAFETIEQRRDPSSLAALKLLKDYGNGFNRLSGDRIIQPTHGAPREKATSKLLSTEEIMRLAGARFLKSLEREIDITELLNSPCDLSLVVLPDEVEKQVKLAELLLASVRKMDDRQLDSAAALLDECDQLSSDGGNPVQRIVYYFSKALRERIDQVTGKIARTPTIDIEEAIMTPNSAVLASHLELPFSQVAHFSGVQALIDHVGEAKKIHMIDLGIRVGMQWTVLMQALACRYDCPVELLKITAIATSMEHLVEETGRRLVSFAKSIGLPFSFKIVMVSDLLDLKEDRFKLDADETVAVYSEYLLRSLIPQPDRLDSLMKVIRKLNPCVMVVVEGEYNSTSPSFVNRFIEALFFFSAYFDCLDHCMRRDDPNRMVVEAMHFGEGVRSILASEGEERKIQNVKIDVWRGFFARFGMEETELSMSSLYQASLVVDKFKCASLCTLDMDGEAMLIGWKGTPLFSISAWKFIYLVTSEDHMTD